MSTTKMGGGLAFAPRKELDMFARMAAEGKRLTGVGALGHGWTFTDAPPEHLVFDLTHEANPTRDYFDIFAAAGWTRVLSVGDIHIFKAAPGTPPVHTSDESRRDELLRQRDRFARYAAAALIVLVLVCLVLRAVTWSAWVEVVVFAVAVVPAVYTVMPLLGYLHRLRRLS